MRVTPDGQKMMVTSVKDVHNHDVSAEEFQLNARVRKLDQSTQEDVKRMLQVNANRKLVQQFFSEKTGKSLLMHDIHNFAASMASSKTPGPEGGKCEPSSLADWFKENHPSLDTEFVLDDQQMVQGIFLQDSIMRSTFSKFPEVILADATHKTNEHDMPFYVLLVIDGNGDSRIGAAFLIHQEDEPSLRKMISIFKDWNQTKVVITDKDMVERNVFKLEMEQVELQICLFHVLRTFSREVTIDKLGVTAGERVTVLEKLQQLAYSKNEDDYMLLYEEFVELCPNHLIQEYFDKNWHQIRKEWVQGLKNQDMNLSSNTNNRIKSFFQKLKSCVSPRDSMKNFISKFLGLVETLRTERRFKNVCGKIPVSESISPTEREYYTVLTPFAFKHVQKQMHRADKVVMIDANTARTLAGPVNVCATSCECSSFKTMGLPCSHIFAVRQTDDLPLFAAELVNERWTRAYNNSRVPIFLKICNFS